MTDRERLIELIGAVQSIGVKYTHEETASSMGFRGNAELADYLLANGVIVPPCKVGQTIYKLIHFNDKNGYYVPQNVVGFHLGEFPHTRGRERKQYIIVYHENTNTISHIDIKKIGKTVFLTKEEAEAKLKELKDNA